VNKKTFFRLAISLCITCSLAGLFLLLCSSRSFQILELKALDLRFSLKGNQPTVSPLLHIDIDDQSLAKLGRWPWPRSYHAKLLAILKECQARSVLFDVLFMEELKDTPEDDVVLSQAIKDFGSVYMPFYFLEDEVPLDPALRDLLLKDITVSVSEAAKILKIDADDLRERMLLAKRSVVDEVVHSQMLKDHQLDIEGLLTRIEEAQGWFLVPEVESYIRENFSNQQLLRFFMDKFSLNYPHPVWPFKKKYTHLSVPIRQYLETVKGSGFINADADIDGVTRKIPLFVLHENRLLAQLTVAALLDFLDVKEIEARPGNIVLKSAHLAQGAKDITIPVDENGCMLVNWQGRWGLSYKHVPYYLILRLQEIRDQLKAQMSAASARPSPEAGVIAYLKKSEAQLKEKLIQTVKDKICLVGLTATGTHDLRPIPLQANYPMVGTHSNLINTIISGNFIRRTSGGFNVFIFFFTAVVIGLCSLVKLWKSLLLAFCYAAGYFLIAFIAFAKFGLWIDLVGPEGIVLFGFSAITSFRYFTEEREKLWIKSAFGHYLSQEVINELLNDPDKLKLGGERKLLTVLFSDVRGFTSFSESHQPEEVVAMLNEILTEQVKVVFKNDGTLDKFVGDELMAFYGAPGIRHLKDHALVAVRTAVEIQARLKEIRQKWSGEKRESLQIGIGINTGEMVVGNMGSAERMDYTVIGDNVNLAARLCSAASKDEIIISETTYEQVKDHIQTEKLEPISVKGKAKPIAIYRVIGMK
jgi:adenylate cyclase